MPKEESVPSSMIKGNEKDEERRLMNTEGPSNQSLRLSEPCEGADAKFKLTASPRLQTEDRLVEKRRKEISRTRPEDSKDGAGSPAPKQQGTPVFFSR